MFFDLKHVYPKILVNRLCHSSSIEVSHTYNPFNYSIHNLPDGLILYMGESENRTNILILNPNTGEIILEKQASSPYQCVCILSDRKIIAHSKKNHVDTFCILDCYSLELEPLFDGYKFEWYMGVQWLFLENKKFLSFTPSSFTAGRTDAPLELRTHDLNTQQYNQMASLPLSIKCEKTSISGLTKLANGKFACRVSSPDSFKIVLFHRDSSDSIEFKVEGDIFPEQRYLGEEQFVGLPNGNILTYGVWGRNCQIWHGTECIEQLDLRLGKHLANKILPMPDDKHWLILSTCDKLLMYNRETHTLKSVKLGGYCPYKIDSLPDSRVMISVSRTRKNEDHDHLLVADFHQFLQKNNASKWVSVSKLSADEDEPTSKLLL